MVIHLSHVDARMLQGLIIFEDFIVSFAVNTHHIMDIGIHAHIGGVVRVFCQYGFNDKFFLLN